MIKMSQFLNGLMPKNDSISQWLAYARKASNTKTRACKGDSLKTIAKQLFSGRGG